MLELAFREDITLTKPPQNGSVKLEGRQFKWTPPKLSSGMQSVLQTLVDGPTTESQLLEQVIALDGPNGAITLYQHLNRLSRLICYSLPWDDQLLATLTPFVPLSEYRFKDNLVNKEQTYVLSRFAYCRRNEAGDLVVESPLGYAYVVLHSPQAGALLAALAQPQSPLALATAVPQLPQEIGVAFMNLLLNAGIIGEVDADGRVQDETDPALGQWDFQDLLFHKQTRMGWKDVPYGGSYRFRDQFEPLPLIKPDLPEDITPLPKPDLDHLMRTEAPFTAVLEQRRSIRHYGQTPITIEQLGEFLYRTARIKKVLRTEEDNLDLSYRPYPAGGAIYELEIYPVVNKCEGLDAGLYYYHPLAHQLHKVSEKTPYVENLLTYAWMAANQQSQPQLLLAITARFQRIQWKYESLAYALILKNVGNLQQTMYLVATAMGLAPCALGGGNASLFANAAGLNSYAETTVGEFLLGSRA